MELFTTVPAYSWLFIYFRKYWNLRSAVLTFIGYKQTDKPNLYIDRIKLIEQLSGRHLINSSNVFVIKGFTVVHPKKEWSKQEIKRYSD